MKRFVLRAVLCALILSGCGDAPEERQMETVVVLVDKMADETASAPEPDFEHQNAPVIGCKDYTPISQSELETSRQAVYELARLAMAEAESEGLYGKAAVVKVAFNRIESTNFPGSVEGVIYQPDQFSSIWDGRFDSVEPDEECFVAVEMVMEGWTCPVVDEALYFSTPESSWWHRAHLEYTGTIGRHEFYKRSERMEEK